jgi:ferrochelatase
MLEDPTPVPPAGLVDDSAHDYDAVLVVSFGGPEGPGDVMPFLDNVLAGLRLPPPAVKKIAARYEAFGGVSPINAHTRAFITALQRELAEHDLKLPVYWGNRNWHPLLPGTVERMRDDGVRRAIAYVTSTFGSYSGCRKYRENLFDAVARLDDAPVIDKLRHGYNHPGFIAAVTDRVRAAFAVLPPDARAAAPLVFTAHSLPESMAKHAPYQGQLHEACRLVAESLDTAPWELAYQSNNASYGEPWLKPTVGDVLRKVADQGARDIVVAPIGFVCDHMEIVLDLDVEAQALATSLGLNLVRAGTVGTHPAFVAMVRELIEERMTADPERRALGEFGPSHDICPANCCLSGRPGTPKPSLAGVAANAGGARP